MASLTLKTGSNRKLVGEEEVLEWAFVLVNEWEGLFIPIFRGIERERKRHLHPGSLQIMNSLNSYFDIGE